MSLPDGGRSSQDPGPEAQAALAPAAPSSMGGPSTTRSGRHAVVPAGWPAHAGIRMWTSRVQVCGPADKGQQTITLK